MKKSLVSLLFVAIWFLSSCDGKANGDPITSASDELEGNWYLLSRMYYHPEEITELQDYVGRGAASDGEYADVIYMYHQVTDRFTHYFTPEQYQATLNAYMGDTDPIVGIGIYMDVRQDTIQLVHIVPNSPASEAGLQRGDQILSVNGNSVTDSAVDLYGEYSKGDVGTVLNLVIRRAGKSIEVQLTKAEIVIPNVWLDFVDSIPIIQVDFFAAADADGQNGTRDEFYTALQNAGDFDAAIIDLRGNPGGSVDQCLGMVDDILDTGIIAYEISRSWDTKTDVVTIDTASVWEVKKGSPFEGRRYVFLADTGSASCSELMLAGVQGNTDWPIVGGTSYGKGIAQNLYTTGAKGLAVITTTEFRDRHFVKYHGVGIVPNYRVLDADSALALALQLAKGQTPALTKRGVGVEDWASVHRVNARLEGRPVRPNGAFRNMTQR